MGSKSAEPRSGRLSHRRAVLVYLLAIVGPTLALLFLGLQSVRRQRQAMTSLTASNLRLSGERLAADLERRVSQLAEACLRDKEIVRTSGSPGVPTTSDEARRLRLLLEGIERRHPIADQLFLIQGDSVRYPILQAPEARLEEDLALDGSEAGRRFGSLFGQAEKLELVEGRPREALASYRKSFELPVADPLKALALARVARCARKLGERRTAEAAYERLAERYGDLSDGFHRPYALVAGLELYDLKKARGQDERGRLAALQVDLAKGRWEVSADQADYFLAQLRERAPDLPVPNWETGYLRRLRLARVLQERFRAPPALREGEIYSSAFTYRAHPHQLHYARVAPEALVGLDVNLAWVKARLLPRASADAGLSKGHIVRLAQRGFGEAGGPRTGIPFQTLFPFWELSVVPAAGEPSRFSVQRDTAIFAGSTLLVIGALALGVILLLRDVSRETQLNRLRSDFVSGVSHELKTPLTLIRLYTETLLADDQFRPQERKGFYQIILRESERLTHLIERALDFGRVERREKQYHLETGNLAPFIAQTIQVYGDYLERRGFSVETHLDPALPAVAFDPDAVAQAVVNLLDNAAKYSGDSKFVGVRLLAEDSAVVFEVADRGIGIPAEEHEKIFRQFYRSGTRSGKGGYGLGLYLVKHIMDAHGGRVEVQSDAGRGSRFRLVFPASPPGADAPSDEASR
jgi:signal transduction histidine kinase